MSEEYFKSKKNTDVPELGITPNTGRLSPITS